MIKNLKKSLVILLILSVICISSTYITSASQTSASENESTDMMLAESSTVDNLENISIEELRQLMNGLIQATIDNNQYYVDRNRSWIEVETHEKLNNFISYNTIGGDGIAYTSIDIVNPLESSTRDTVILVNAKISYSDNSYNKVIMYELHINEKGKLYGYNVWAY